MSKDKRKYKGVKFINAQFPDCDAETVDEFTTWKEAREMIKEYRVMYGYDSSLWISQRPYVGWYN